MEETSFLTSKYRGRTFSIHGRSIHLQTSQKRKFTWFVNICQDTACQLQYIGSTSDACNRWSATKSACISRKKSNTGLYKHFMDGCPTHMETGNVQHLVWTLVDFIETSEERLNEVGHIGGVSCRCSECRRLENQKDKDKWICHLRTLFAPYWLNTRDKIKARSRVKFLQTYRILISFCHFI